MSGFNLAKGACSCMEGEFSCSAGGFSFEDFSLGIGSVRVSGYAAECRGIHGYSFGYEKLRHSVLTQHGS